MSLITDNDEVDYLMNLFITNEMINIKGRIIISTFASNVGGGGINTACNFGNLGFNTSAIFKIGKDCPLIINNIISIT